MLEQLYKHTPLEEGFGINNVALVGGSPRTLGLRELLDVYVQHRLSVVTRRSEYRLARRRERLHLVEGLLVAILDIDEVIEVIRSSDDSEAARTRLQDVFDLSEVQAEYILELRLRRLTKFSRLELEGERDQLLADIAALEELLASDERLRAQVALELTEVSDKFATPRRTLLTEADAPVRGGKKAVVDPESLQVADAPCRVLLSTTGRIIRVDVAPSELDVVRVPKRSKHDAVLSSVLSTVRGQVGALTATGRIVRFSPVDVPAVPPAAVRLDAGVRINDYLGIPRSEAVVAVVDLGAAAEHSLAIGTAQGVVKRVVPGAWPDKPEFPAIGLKPGDRVVGAAQSPESDDLVFVTSNAQLLRFGAAAVRPQGLPAGGVAGVALASGASVIWFGAVTPSEDAVVATVSTSSSALPGTETGRAKVSSLAEFPAKGRATQGVRAHAFLKGEDGLTVGVGGHRAAARRRCRRRRADPAGLDVEARRVRQPARRRGRDDRRECRGARRHARRGVGGARGAAARCRGVVQRRLGSGGVSERGALGARQTSMRSRSRPSPARMNSLRGATSLPMSSSKTFAAPSASLTLTRRSVRCVRSIVVSASWSASISPSPLYRWIGSWYFLPDFTSFLSSVWSSCSEYVYSVSFGLPRFTTTTRCSGGTAANTRPCSIIGRMYRKNRVSSSVRMWAPSTSASDMMMTLPYRAWSSSNVRPEPAPMTWMIDAHSALPSMSDTDAFCTLRILPRMGSSAWYSLLRASLAVPSAESPSTMKSSVPSTSFDRQSASFVGSEEFSSAFLRRWVSLWARAEMRDFISETTFSSSDRRLGLLGALRRGEDLGEALRHDLVDDLADRRGAEDLFRLALELRLGQPDGQHGGHAGQHVVLVELVLPHLELAGVGLDLGADGLHQRRSRSRPGGCRPSGSR